MVTNSRDGPFNENCTFRDYRSALATYVWFLKHQCCLSDQNCPLGVSLERAFAVSQELAEEKGLYLNIELAFEVPRDIYVASETLERGLLSVVERVALEYSQVKDFTLVADLDVYPSSFVFFIVVYADDENQPKRLITYNGSAELLQRVLEINFIQRSKDRFVN